MRAAHRSSCKSISFVQSPSEVYTKTMNLTSFLPPFCKALLYVLTLVVVLRAYQNVGVDVSSSTTFTTNIKLPSMTFCSHVNDIWPLPKNITPQDFQTMLTDPRETIETAHMCYKDRATDFK